MVKINFAKKWKSLRIFCPRLYINISGFFWSRYSVLVARGNSACKVLVSIKVLPVKNDYFLHAKFELQRYQQMNGFLYWYNFYWKKFGTCISHKPIARLIPTWIWYDLLTLSQILPSNHQLLNSFNFVSLK